VVLTDGLTTPRRMLVEDDAIYLSEARSLSLPTGRVLRVSRQGGAPEELGAGFTAPDALAADADSVYVVDRDGVWAMPKGGSGPTLVAPPLNNAVAGDTDLLVAGADLVLATGARNLLRITKLGGAITVLHQAPGGSVIRSAVLDGATVLFVRSGDSAQGLYAVPLDGSAAATRLSPDPEDGRSLRLFGEHLYWTSGTGGAGTVGRMNRDGSSVEVLASGLKAPSRPVVRYPFLYFKDSTASEPPSALFLRRVSLCNPGTPDIVGPVGTGPGDLHEAGGALVFTSQETGGLGYLGELR
jgi:hypothetical protein